MAWIGPGGRRWWDPTGTRAPVFPKAQLYNITELVGLSQVAGHIAAFGDFNSDRFTDIFVVSPDRQLLQVHLWDTDNWKFSSSVAATVTTATPIVNVAVNDINYDGALDVVLSTAAEADAISVRILLNSGTSTFIEGSTVTGLIDQPLLFDLNGDLRTDLLAPTRNGTAVFLNNGTGTFSEPTFLGFPGLVSPHSNSFLDINGDCHADILFTEKAPGSGKTLLNIWIWNSTFRHNVSHELPDGSGQLTFADFNRDGSIDMAFPVCVPAGSCAQENSIVIATTIQMGICGSALSSSSRCRKMTDMCRADLEWHFPNLTSPVTAEGITVIPKSIFDTYGVRMFRTSALPLTLRAGDYNLDGYPDLLVPVIDTKTNVVSTMLWESLPCNSTLCPELHWANEKAAPKSNQRTLRPRFQGTEELARIRGAYAAAFVDFGENGMLGIVALSDSLYDPNATEGRKVHALFNNFRPDALFVKALGLNGVCAEWCPTGAKFPDPKPYGVSYPGGAWKFALTDTDGTSLGAAGVQSYQSAYLPLLTPYVMFGLGRISNYLQAVFYGVSSSEANWKNYWQGVIPNSQLVAIPYKPNNPPYWTLELFLSPSGIVFWVLLAVGLLLLTLGGVIIFFKWRERKEDQKSREQGRHLFDFNAL